MEKPHFTKEDIRSMRDVLNSYLGLMSHYKVYHLLYTLLQKKAPAVFDKYVFLVKI